MSTQRNFRKFHDAIKLSREDSKYRDAREKDDSICAALKEKFKEAGHPVVETFIQGSLKTSTTIKHPKNDFDIDRALVIDASTAPADPVEVKKLVCSVLEKRGFKNAKIKMPCVTADYANLNLHVDIVVYRRNGDSYELAVGKRNSGDAVKVWSPSDPKGLIDNINDKSAYIGSSEDKLSQYKRLVRYMKRWRDEKFEDAARKKVYSIGITVMLKEQFKPAMDKEGKPNDLQALRDTVAAILNGGYFKELPDGNYRVKVNLPVTPYRDIFDNSGVKTGTQFWNKLNVMLRKLDNALTEESLKKQCDILRELLGDDFETAEESNRNEAAKVAYSCAGSVGTSQGA
ncbi:nucleotidyltransferase [Halomonas sp. MCCC 1A11062]|uniref:nucleotidyltransferase domain-containing protein n=1 Tax=Halomonas sp. MCCC 1A11062 TaxID=2733485 RepID=UPI001F29A91F|nr:nucleotidyltransferase [Halomonas sp. MCCC 1A11062]MCE8039809.1 nucleotidyltransferase [Halomonas sp. MCCC 1A11062]